MRPRRSMALGVVPLVAGAILLLGAMDCFASGLLDVQAMECCASMPCTPMNQGQDCCKNMQTDEALYVVPPATTSVAPVVAVVQLAVTPAAPDPAIVSQHSDAPFDISAHAPPLELYTAYRSLLI